MAKPFLKWAGGKHYLADEILKRLPQNINTYYEPAVGAGAIFFELAEQKRFKKACISDINSELIKTYATIKNNVNGLIMLLQTIEYRHNKAKHPHDYYYKMRELDVSLLNDVQTAARMIYLNRTGWHGLYRVNKSGGFNVPPGPDLHPTILNEANLRAVSRVLKNVTITCQDFEVTIKPAINGDAVYIDPPYWPVKQGGFVSYTGSGFSSTEQIRVAAVAQKLKDKNVHVVLSNAAVPAVEKLYAGFEIDHVEVPRRISSNGAGRGKVGEVLIMSQRI